MVSLPPFPPPFPPFESDAEKRRRAQREEDDFITRRVAKVADAASIVDTERELIKDCEKLMNDGWESLRLARQALVKNGLDADIRSDIDKAHDALRSAELQIRFSANSLAKAIKTLDNLRFELKQ